MMTRWQDDEEYAGVARDHEYDGEELFQSASVIVNERPYSNQLQQPLTHLKRVMYVVFVMVVF